MSKLDQFDFAKLGSVLAIANTPLYLAQRLQEESTVRAISVTMSAEEILEELNKAIAKKPENLQEAAKAYALLVAISLNPQAAFLRRTLDLNPSYADEWYNYIRSYLIQTHQPTFRQFIEIRTPPSFSNVSSSSTSQVVVQAPADANEAR